MPARKVTRRPRRTYRKRPTKKRTLSRREGVRPLVMPMAPPPRLMTKLIYSDHKEYTAVYPTYSAQTYRTASMYDIDLTGTGGQAGWWDQLKGWYRAYIVRGAKFRFTIINKAAEVAKVNFIVSSSSDGPLSTALEWRSLSNFYNREMLIPPTGSGGAKFYSVYVDNYKAQGLGNLSSKMVQNNPLVASIGSSPTLTPYMQLKVITADNSGTHDLIIKTDVVLYVELFNRKLAQGDDS